MYGAYFGRDTVIKSKKSMIYQINKLEKIKSCEIILYKTESISEMMEELL